VRDTEDGGKHRHKQSSGSLGRETYAGIQKYEKNKHSRSKLDAIKFFVGIQAIQKNFPSCSPQYSVSRMQPQNLTFVILRCDILVVYQITVWKINMKSSHKHNYIRLL
jgi:hypothetical protein